MIILIIKKGIFFKNLMYHITLKKVKKRKEYLEKKKCLNYIVIQRIKKKRKCFSDNYTKNYYNCLIPLSFK